MSQPLNLKKETDNIQNELLFLFLKYNLGFHSNISTATDLLTHFQEKRKLLMHCCLHAVAGNSTDKDPMIQLAISPSIDDQYWLEIKSSGDPQTFFYQFDEYCKDVMLNEYVKSVGLTSLISDLTNELIEIAADDDHKGSKIRFKLN